MPSFAEMLRLKNLFGQTPIGSDLPQDGGMMGMPYPTDIGPISLGGSRQPPTRQDPYGNISFGPQEKIAPREVALAAPQVPSNPGYDVGARMREIYKPETTATDRFNEGIGQYPESQKPGWLKVIGATLADYAKPGSGMGVIEGDRTRKLADWKAKMGPMQDAANMERYSNTNNRTLAYQTVSQELKQQADIERDKNADAKTKIAADRAEVYRLKSTAKNYKFNFGGPKVLITDEDTGEVRATDINTGSLTDADKAELTQKHALARQEQGARNTANQIDQRNMHAEGMQETGAWGQPVEITDPADPTKKIAISVNSATGKARRVTLDEGTVSGLTRPGGAGANRVEQPTQTRVRQADAADMIRNTRPDLAKFVRGQGNEINITPPSPSSYMGLGGPTGPTQAQYDEINDIIYGKGRIRVNQPSRTGAPTTNSSTPPVAAPVATAGKVKVTKGGKTFMLPASQVEAAKLQGYTLVQ